MKIRCWLVIAVVMVCIGAVAAACEKSNATVVQQQLQDSQNACAKGCESQVPGCDIKGNVNNLGKRFYHVPGSRSYALFKLVAAQGDRWFCTEQQARANGFVRVDN